jgi:hypothetical protein
VIGYAELVLAFSIRCFGICDSLAVIGIVFEGRSPRAVVVVVYYGYVAVVESD